MITRCPSCHTRFRVHAEQLAARAGQVRCGKCSRVFNALGHLIEEAAALGAAAQAPQPAPNPAAELAAEAGTSAAEAARPASLQPVNAGPGAGAAFDFGPAAAAQPAARRRRWPWALGALLLLLTLLAQAAFHYRGTVAVLFPEAKPYAAALCARLGCEIPLPRRIEMISIEASDLQADTTNPNVMVLSATVKNRAIFAQQHPLLELTLTDSQDQPLVRRVLAPQDYLGKAVNTQAGFGANTEAAIKVYIEGSQVKATGYRLYLFYS